MKFGSYFSLVAIVALLAGAVPAQLIVNEVHGFGAGATPALPGDYLELWNQTPNAISLAGYTIGIWSGDTGAVTTRVIPCSPEGRHIIPGNCFWVMQEGGTLGGPLTGTLAGLVGMAGLPGSWSSNSNIGVYVLDPMGNCVDYVYLRRGTTAVPATPPNLPAGCTFTVTNIGTTGTGFGHIHRLTNVDTNSSTDWAQTATADPGTPGALNTTGTATQTSTGACTPAPNVTAAFETNSPEARLSINNVENTAFSGPIDVSICPNEVASLAIESTLIGQPWDLCYTTAPVRSGATLCGPGTGGVTTANGQVINLDFTAPDFACLGNLTFQNSWGGNINTTFSIPNTVPNLSAQFVILDPNAPDGYRLSAPIQLHVGAGSRTLTLSDDSSTVVSFASAPLCGTGFTFCGTNYTQMTVISNGRVMFGGSDTDLSPTVAEALLDNPFVGFWTDLNPSSTSGAGSVTVSHDGSGVYRINWNGVPYFGELSTSNTFSIVLDSNNGTVALDGLQGIVPNPATGLTTIGTGDAQFLGLSCGTLGATNGGATTFGIGGPTCPAATTDMIYDFIGSGATPPAIVPSLAGASTLNRITFTPNPAGGYCWTGS